MKKDILFFTGGENFKTIIEKNAYYVDKTAYLKTLFMSSSETMNPLFIRPRRFGKTLNLSMIKEFCELNYKNPGDKSYQQKLFINNGRKLAVAGDEYKELRDKIMGEFPVISISFKGVEGNTFASAVSSLLGIISELYLKFNFLTKSEKLEDTLKSKFKDILEFSNLEYSNLYDREKLSKAVSVCEVFIPSLAQMLFREYGRQVIVMIDEYDVPLQKAVVAKEPYYDEMLEIVRKISVSTFKQNPDPWLYKGIITGCLRIAHQSVFTDANNFTTYGMSDAPYTGFFGFTKEETEKLLSDSELSDKKTIVKEWYDGYLFGEDHIFCPWSLISYCAKASLNPSINPEPFWINTSGNDLITMFTRNSMEAHDAENLSKLQQLMDENCIEISVGEFSTDPDIQHNLDFDTFMTMMLHTGYVTYTEDSGSLDKIKIRIPNKEVRSCFEKKISSLYNRTNPYWFNQAMNLVDLLMENKAEAARSLINTMLKEFLSIRNTGHELYYHGFLTGILGLATAAKGIKYHEEIETGSGFSDVIIDNFDSKTVCILELKRVKALSDCYDAALAATQQIISKNYASAFISQKYKNVYGIGMGFAAKSCEIAALGNLVEKDK